MRIEVTVFALLINKHALKVAIENWIFFPMSYHGVGCTGCASHLDRGWVAEETISSQVVPLKPAANAASTALARTQLLSTP